MTWTPKKENKLIELCEEGLTAQRISEILGFTRSAILGKIKRMGLNLEKSKVEKHPSHKAKNHYFKEDPLDTDKTWRDVGNNECRFERREGYCCALPTIGSWCLYHAKIVYSASPKKSGPVNKTHFE